MCNLGVSLFEKLDINACFVGQSSDLAKLSRQEQLRYQGHLRGR